MFDLDEKFYEKLKKDNKCLITRIQLDRNIIEKEENEYPYHLNYKNLKFIEQSLSVLPLWNGGLNGEGNYDFLVILNINKGLKLKKDFHNTYIIKKKDEND